MPVNTSWGKLPKFVQALIVTVTLVLLALIITFLLFDQAKDSGMIDYKTETIVFFVSGGIAVFILVFMLLSREFRRISAVLILVGVIGLTWKFIDTKYYRQSLTHFSNEEISLEDGIDHFPTDMMIMDSIFLGYNSGDSSIEILRHFNEELYSENKTLKNLLLYGESFTGTGKPGADRLSRYFDDTAFIRNN